MARKFELAGLSNPHPIGNEIKIVTHNSAIKYFIKHYTIFVRFKKFNICNVTLNSNTFWLMFLCLEYPPIEPNLFSRTLKNAGQQWQNIRPPLNASSNTMKDAIFKTFFYSQKRRWVDKMFMHRKVDFLDKLLIPLGWKLLTVLPRYLYKSLGHYSWKLFEFKQIMHTLNTTNFYITKKTSMQKYQFWLEYFIY